MVKLNGKITGNQLNKCFDEVLKIAEKDGHILGKSSAWGICLESIEVIPNEIEVDFEANTNANDMVSWDKENPIWAINVCWLQTGKIYQVRPERYDWDLKKSFDKVAKLIKKEISK